MQLRALMVLDELFRKERPGKTHREPLCAVPPGGFALRKLYRSPRTPRFGKD